MVHCLVIWTCDLAILLGTVFSLRLCDCATVSVPLELINDISCVNLSSILIGLRAAMFVMG
jgi:hypothetical protein